MPSSSRWPTWRTRRHNSHDRTEYICHGTGGLTADLEAARMLVVHSISFLERGQVPYTQAAMTKVFSSELEERLPEVAMELLGTAGTLSAGAPGALLGGTFEFALRDSIYKVIGGGSNEIQRTLIAIRGLGLPR